MEVRYLFSIFLLFVSACAPILVSPPTDSGIVGQVTIGPMCPVVQVGNPCPDKPYQATLTVLNSGSRSEVVQFQSDANGAFRAALQPGGYILHPESPNVMPHALDIYFVVYAHKFTRLDVTYDSGIR